LLFKELKMNKFVENVIDFNKSILKIDQRNLDFIDESEYQISVNALREELQEFIESYNVGDFIGCIDAMVDLRYFAVGVLYKFGLDAELINKCDTIVHNANMTKVRGVNARRGDGTAADAIKPENWKSPEEQISDILDGLL